MLVLQSAGRLSVPVSRVGLWIRDRRPSGGHRYGSVVGLGMTWRISGLYAEGAFWRQHTFRDPEPGYLARVFAEEESAECRFGVPIADGDQAAVPWSAQARLADKSIDESADIASLSGRAGPKNSLQPATACFHISLASSASPFVTFPFRALRIGCGEQGKDSPL